MKLFFFKSSTREPQPEKCFALLFCLLMYFFPMTLDVILSTVSICPVELVCTHSTTLVHVRAQVPSYRVRRSLGEVDCTIQTRLATIDSFCVAKKYDVAER